MHAAGARILRQTERFDVPIQRKYQAVTSVEVWRAIPSWPAYEVSDQGRVRRADTKQLKAIGWVGPRRNYANVQLAINETATKARQRMAREGMTDAEIEAAMKVRRSRRMVNVRVHLAVLEAFVGPRPPGHVARHGGGGSRDNRLVNLSWGTPSENETDKIEHGTHHQRAKTHCPRRHAYTPDNVYDPSMKVRRCKTCARERAAAQYAERKTQRSLSDDATTRPGRVPGRA
jgi:hypothetical protein